MTHTTILVEYEGAPPFVGLFASMLEDDDLQVSYEPPLETRSIEQEAARVVLTVVATKGTEAAGRQIMAAIDRFRLRHRAAKIEILDDGTSPGTEG